MMVNYIGEHLLPGLSGRIFVWISFTAALLSLLSYLFLLSGKEKPAFPFRRLARGFFSLHLISIIGVALVLYWIIFRHYFEYSYVWEYSSRDMPFKYIISCFWAGQEGSFLIWTLFQAIIGIVLIIRAKEWENYVMPVVSLSQVFLTSMMLGLQFASFKIGSSPFALLRETYMNVKDSIFLHPDYLKMIPDGNGLNPLLENIWMTIHPPILFLGYALALVPFSYAVGALIRKDYQSWIRPAIPWTLVSLMVLGAGILLGGAWAYVSLTFGGFWAWDPVENSSLVPWMTLVACLHFLMISRKQHYALFSSFLFAGLSYVLVLYASFLTRSGVLANTSAHSFGDNGMTGQLLIFLLVFLAILVTLLAIRTRKFSEKIKDILLSREFWMFMGSIVIVLAAFQIIFTTSIPVVNQLFHANLAPPSDSVAFYNRWQMPYALLIAGFIAFSQFLNYSENSGRQFLKKMLVPVVVSVLLVIPFTIAGIVTSPSFIMFLFFILFSLVSSLYNFFFKASRPRNPGAILTHIGFIIFLLGVLITFSNSKVISTNTSGYDLGDMKMNAENQMLVKGDTLYMGGFYLAYTGKTTHGNLTEYKVDFLTRKSGKYVYKFSLYPSVNRNPRMGNVFNPDTRHYLWRDYYMYISSAGNDPDFIVVKAIMNPYINVLWLGAVILILGFGYSLYRRLRARTIRST